MPEPVVGPGKFTIYSYDFGLNLLGEIPRGQLSFGSVLSGSGAFSTTVPMPLPEAKIGNPRNLDTRTKPGSCFVFIDMDGTIVWGGFLWNRSFSQNSGAPTWQIGGNELASYWDLRLIPQDIGPTSKPPVHNIDPRILLAGLLFEAESIPFGNPGFNLPSVSGTSIYEVQPQYQKINETTVGQVLSDMAAGNGLAEWMMNVYWASSGPKIPVMDFQMATPRLGLAAFASFRPPITLPVIGTGSLNPNGLVLDLQRCPAPGYTWPEDAKQSANKIVEGGYGYGTSQLTATSQDTLSGNDLLFELNISEVVQENKQTLQSFADSDLARLRQPVTVPTVPILSNGTPGLNDVVLGQQVRLTTKGDERFPDGFASDDYRVVQIGTNVPDDGDAVTTLTLNYLPTAYPWPTAVYHGGGGS